METGTIIKGIGGFYYIDTENGVYECRARGIFRKDKVTPLVGDRVQITILDEENKKGSLDRIEARRNELLRPRVANVDQAVIVFAALNPALNPDLLDRFLILAQEQGLLVLIGINKIDLDEQKDYQQIKAVYEQAGYSVLALSADKGVGIDALRQALEGKISVFAGPSGAGKSSLINTLSPELALNTGEVSQKIKRGRHTTRHAELMELSPGSYIVDSPGFTSLYLDHVPKEELKNYFLEFVPMEGRCKYHGCSHIHEPGCAVKEEVGKGISPMRYERYTAIYRELDKERKY